MTKEIIREVVPPGMSVQIQTLTNEIFDINDQYDKLSIKAHDLKDELKARDKYIGKLERQVIDVSKQLKQSQSDFNQAEKHSFNAKKDIEFLRSIKLS